MTAGKDDETDTRDLAPYFPQFMWLLRDFGLKLVDPDGNSITSRQYLESALTKMSKDKSKNEVRSVITSVFPYRDCTTLVIDSPSLELSVHIGSTCGRRRRLAEFRQSSL